MSGTLDRTNVPCQRTACGDVAHLPQRDRKLLYTQLRPGTGRSGRGIRVDLSVASRARTADGQLRGLIGGLAVVEADHESSLPDCRPDEISSIADESAAVVTSPIARYSAMSRSRRRRIWPGVGSVCADDRRIDGRRVRHQRRLDLRRRIAVAAHIHHVVDAARQPSVSDVAVLRAVAGDVAALLAEARPVRACPPAVAVPASSGRCARSPTITITPWQTSRF